jgi:hypothetical protein
VQLLKIRKKSTKRGPHASESAFSSVDKACPV